MGRIRAFEFNELPWVPGFIRDSITETLGLAWRKSGAFSSVGDAFADFCRRSGCRVFLDLGSGSGEPVALLAEALAEKGIDTISFILSDLYPHVPSMERVAARHPGVRFHPLPVDASDVPGDIRCDAYTIMTAFHHFPPPVAAAILADCARKRKPIFIMDGPSLRHMFTSIPFGLMPSAVFTMFANPFLAPEDRLLKIFFTYLIPLIPLADMWDSLVSALRFYSSAELLDMARGISGDFDWECREIRTPRGLPLTIFTGIPR
jgi:SAM-dependent methyltransferase